MYAETKNVVIVETMLIKTTGTNTGERILKCFMIWIFDGKKKNAIFCKNHVELGAKCSGVNTFVKSKMSKRIIAQMLPGNVKGKRLEMTFPKMQSSKSNKS